MWVLGVIGVLLGGWILFSVGVIVGILGTRRRHALAAKKIYELGVEDGKKQVTEGRYREPAALPPEPPPSPLEAVMERGMRMIAAAGMWMDENRRAERERKR